MADVVVQVIPGPPVREQDANTDLPPFASPQELQFFTKGKIKASESRVPAALAAVSSEIRRAAGWHIWPILRNHELVLDGSGGRIQYVPTLRLLEVKAASSAGVTILPENIDPSQLGLLEARGFLWTRRYSQVRLTIDHGWEEAPELKALCLSLAARALASPMGATREQAGSISVNWAMTSSVSGGILPTSAELATIHRYQTVEA